MDDLDPNAVRRAYQQYERHGRTRPIKDLLEQRERMREIERKRQERDRERRDERGKR